jgi:hypothetical protein
MTWDFCLRGEKFATNHKKKVFGALFAFDVMRKVGLENVSFE